MEVELEPRVKPLPYKVKGMSRESPSQKGAHILDTDLRSHWSTGTNTKEWILLELDEPCLLSHIRIYNKSVLEWEISVGLRYKPETFVKVRPRCEAPRRDMMYPMNYTPCRYVRISCLRGNPIAIFFIQLIGVTVTGLEPEFQPVITYLLPHIISQKLDAHDMHLQLLQDMSNRLTVFLPQLEAELNSFSDAAEPNIRFLAMLAGPLYPILHIVNERETARLAGSSSDSEASKSSHPSSALLVSSNFEPRRYRTASPILLPTSSSIVFRPDAILVLLRKAYKDSNLGTVCRMASRILLKFVEPIAVQKSSVLSDATPFVFDEASISEPASPVRVVDYSNLFGEEFQISDDHWDSSYLNVLDIRAVEEGVLHVLYSCASQPLFCSKLADSTSDFWAALPLVQALLPALRPNVSSPDQVDDNFTPWKQPFVQHALSQIVAASSSAIYHPLLRGCAGYLSSFSPSHAKAACVLIDLCSSVLAPWMAQVIAKVDLTLELLEDLLGVIQGARHSLTRARAALKYIVLALSGHMDDIMARYKEVKHRILFLVEMLEPFLDPAITPLKSMIAFGNVSAIYLEKQENTCAIALNVIRTAVRKSAVLPSLESEWRRGSVAPSVLLSILEPHMQLPPDIDLRKFSVSEPLEPQASNAPPLSSGLSHGGVSAKFNSQDDADGKADVSDTSKIDIFDDVSLVFAPPELRSTTLTNVCGSPDKRSLDLSHSNVGIEEKHVIEKNVNRQFHNSIGLDTDYAIEHSDLHADYLQLMSYRDSELWASEFRHLAFDLHSQNESTPESHSAAIDALLLAAECYVNPFFLMSFKQSAKVNQTTDNCRINGKYEFADLRRVLEESHNNLETISHLERKRDTIVLQILLEAAKLDIEYGGTVSDGEPCSSGAEGNEEVINLSEHDNLYVDAITLVRQNQELLYNFLIQRLLREKNSMHEVLMQSLVFLLHSATKLFCTPENVIDITLESAEFFNGLLMSFYYQFKEGNLQLDPIKVHEVQRRWVLLQRLVIASSGDEEGLDKSISMNNGFQFANLIPPSAWIQRIPTFSSSSSPLVRFLGWMAVSRNAKVYQKERLFLASDLSQLMYLLSIFSDELAVVDNIVNQKDENMNIEQQGLKQHIGTDKGLKLPGQQYEDQSFRVMHPDISQVFPNMRKHFESFGEIILEAVGLQLRSLSSSVVPDLLCWFSDLCSWPFLQKDKDRLSSAHNSDIFKGFVGKNARAIILYVLEAIVIEHMEAMVPEVPRVVQVLVSLCQTSYCDVAFLESILGLLNPIITYSLHKVSDEEKLLIDDSCLNFESLCFDELFCNLRSNNDNQENSAKSEFSRPLTIFILGSVFPDLTFNRKREILQSLIFWADFAAFEPTTSFHDYICAFQTIMESCKLLLVETLRIWGVIPLKRPLHSDTSICAPSDDTSESHSWFLNDVCNNRSFPTSVCKKVENNYDDAGIVNRRVCHLSVEEAISFSKDLEGLISKLNPTIELCSKLHYQLAKNLTLTSTQCFMYSRCLSSIAENVSISAGVEKENVLPSDLADNFPVHWRISLEGLAEMIVVLLETRCWEVASIMLDCVLGMPLCFCLDNVIGSICSAIKTLSCSAPKIAWRLQTDKWLSSLLARGIHSHHESEIPLVDLLSAMLGHPEPEQRFIALNHLGKLVCRDVDGGTAFLPSSTCNKLTLPKLVISSCHAISSPLISSTWDRVVVVASSDKSLPLRTRAIALLVSYVPFAERHQLQSLLTAADRILHGLTNLAHPTCEGPLIQISLALIASVCLYSPAEDISLIPQIVWTNIETLGKLETERRSGDLEKKACQALCRLKDEGDDAKEILKEVFSSSSPRQVDPDFGSTRESILQSIISMLHVLTKLSRESKVQPYLVLANLTSVQSYFNFFSKKTEEKVMELEEAEMEMDLIQKELGLQESSKHPKDSHQHSVLPNNVNDDNRLQQIRDSIRSLEKSKLKEEIIARRQKKLLVRRARQKYLEEAAVQEAELLQQLDRERTTEVEREIERQRLLDLERAKTRELRHNLDMEKEKQTQREVQRELEQAESGLRPSRREFPSSTQNSRPRERYRERENGRSGNEGSLRSSSGSLQPESGMPTVVLSGSRQFSGQHPTILQSRDRQDEGGSSYEENFDGSRDSGDTGSVGDPDLVSALEGQPGGFGSSQRHGSRGSKSRQIMERRERDGRREGKWERKH